MVSSRKNAIGTWTVATIALMALLWSTISITAAGAATGTDPIGTVVEYDVGSSPGPMLASSDGSIWTGGFANQLVQITPTGEVVLRDTTGAPLNPLEHPEGTMWFGTFGGSSVGRFRDGAVEQFSTAGAVTGNLVLGPDGKVWFSDSAGGVGNVDANGVVFENATHDATRDLLVGPNGNIWFADDGDASNVFIGQVDMENNLVEYPVDGYTSGAGGKPGMVAAPDGNIWFGVFPEAKIGYVSMDGVVAYVDTPTMTRHPIVGPDGNIWFGADEMIGRVDLTSHEVRTWPTSYDTDYLATGSDGNIWFGQYGPKLGRITPDGTLTEFDTSNFPQFLVLGADGNIWYGSSDHVVGRITPAGTVTELPTSDSTTYLMAGPDGTVWFATEGSPTSGSLGKVVAARSTLAVAYDCQGAAECEVAPGDALNLSATITNEGPSDAGEPRLVLSVPSGLSVTSVSPPQGWVCELPAGGSAAVECSSGQLVTGANLSFGIEAVVASSAGAGTTLVSAADATSAAPDPDPSKGHAEVSIHVTQAMVPRFTG